VASDGGRRLRREHTASVALSHALTLRCLYWPPAAFYSQTRKLHRYTLSLALHTRTTVRRNLSYVHFSLILPAEDKHGQTGKFHTCIFLLNFVQQRLGNSTLVVVVVVIIIVVNSRSPLLTETSFSDETRTEVNRVSVSHWTWSVAVAHARSRPRFNCRSGRRCSRSLIQRACFDVNFSDRKETATLSSVLSVTVGKVVAPNIIKSIGLKLKFVYTGRRCGSRLGWPWRFERWSSWHGRSKLRLANHFVQGESQVAVSGAELGLQDTTSNLEW